MQIRVIIDTKTKTITHGKYVISGPDADKLIRQVEEEAIIDEKNKILKEFVIITNPEDKIKATKIFKEALREHPNNDPEIVCQQKMTSIIMAGHL